MKKQESTIGKWTMKTKFEKWFTQVGLKIQGVKASEEWKLIPIIGFFLVRGVNEPISKIRQKL